MTASDLEKSDLGTNRFYSALNMPYLNGKIIGAKRVRTFIANSGWPITLQLPLDTLPYLTIIISPQNALARITRRARACGVLRGLTRQ